MKKTWQAPRIQVQEFETNEYVATCYSLYCKVAGDGEGHFYEKTWFKEDVPEWGNLGTIKCDGQLHGQPCANGSSYHEETKQFYENSKPVSFVDSVNLGSEASPGKWYATWGSTDGGAAATGRYNHYGYAVLDDANRPNHS